LPVTELVALVAPPLPLPPLLPPRVGDGDGDGEVRGEGNGPTPMVKGSIGSVAIRLLPRLRRGVVTPAAGVLSLVSLNVRSSHDCERFFSIVMPRWISRSLAISLLPKSPVSSTFSLFSLSQPAVWPPLLVQLTGLTGLWLVLQRRHRLDADK